MDKSAFTPFEVLTSGSFVCCSGFEGGAYANRLINFCGDGFVRTALLHLVLAEDDRSGSLELNYS